MRLDVFLAEKSFARSRSEAKQLIEAGAVTAKGRTLDKPSMSVEGIEEDIIVDRTAKKYASRGGTKLEGALAAFNLSVEGVRARDIGASSGGLTDCLLQNGALSVIALDSGKDQLIDSLRRDRRVTVIEGYNARYLSIEDLPYEPNFAVMDVSFISATYTGGHSRISPKISQSGCLSHSYPEAKSQYNKQNTYQQYNKCNYSMGATLTHNSIKYFYLRSNSYPI